MHSLGGHTHKYRHVTLEVDRLACVPGPQSHGPSEVHTRVGKGWGRSRPDSRKKTHDPCYRLGQHPLTGDTLPGHAFEEVPRTDDDEGTSNDSHECGRARVAVSSVQCDQQKSREGGLSGEWNEFGGCVGSVWVPNAAKGDQMS